ncbi:transcriptional regulator [Streptomyces humidus]|uniref:Transcriptional regulator n=1 Tax=Streptomyces humidus TaxID=52259 RepID=A0A918L5K6_9ACTN|nr:AraC family transcriptional regulator [Streptomyces humidus]GGS09672.1 transcriptional regulator [Streptomyces humidus]
MDKAQLARATIPPVILTGLLELADQHRIETAGWFAGTGLDRARLEQPRTLVSYRQAITVIRRALKELPAGPIGLMIGSRDPLLTWGTLGTAVRSAPTGAEARRVATRFHQGAGTMLDYVVSRTEQANVVELLPRTREPDLLVFLSEEAFAGIVALTRLMFGPSSGPLAAELSYPPPPWAAAYARLWRCPVAFDCERTTLTLPGALEERRVPTANATQFEAALHATRAILESEPVDDLVAAVEGALRQDLRSRRTATQVADALGMSPRTLHRHLARAGYSFGTIQDRVRRQQADVLLMRTRRPITAIAAELGYSDPREFRRAYKRWTDTTPTRARQSMRPP